MHAGAVIVPAVLAVCGAGKDLRASDALRGIAVGVELMCRASLVAPKLIHKAGFHPTAVLGAMGAAAAAAAALNLSKSAVRERAGHRRLDGLRHHRVPRRGRVDQAHAPGLGGAVGHPRRATWRARASSGRAPCSRARTASTTASRAPRSGDWEKLLDGFGSAGSPSTHRLQALRLRHHDASVHRLRAPPRQEGRSRRHRGNRLRGRGRHGAPPVGAARREAAPAERLRRASSASPTASPPASSSAMPGSTRSPRSACATRACVALAAQGALRDRPGQSLPGRIHRPRARANEGRHRARGAPAASARRRARAAVARRPRGEVPAQLRLRRLEPAQAESSSTGRKARSTRALIDAFARSGAEKLDQRVERGIRRLGHQRVAGELDRHASSHPAIFSCKRLRGARRRHHVALAEDEAAPGISPSRRSRIRRRSRCRP